MRGAAPRWCSFTAARSAVGLARWCIGVFRVDAENRKGKAFRCIRCARVDDADVNAAKMMRQRTLRWLALKSAGHSDREAAETLWRALRTARKESKRWGADRVEATTKPACAAISARTHNGVAGAMSIAPAGSPHRGCRLTSGRLREGAKYYVFSSPAMRCPATGIRRSG